MISFSVSNLLPTCLDQVSYKLVETFKLSDSDQGDASDLSTIINLGSWMLHRCFGRLGVPITPCGGFHSMDDRDMQVHTPSAVNSLFGFIYTTCIARKIIQ